MVYMNSKGGGALAPQNGMEIQINGAKAPSPRALEGSVLVLQKIQMELKRHPQYLYKIEFNKKSYSCCKKCNYSLGVLSVDGNFCTGIIVKYKK